MSSELCQSINFAAKRPSGGKFARCCHKDKIKLVKPTDTAGNVLFFPDFLHDLMSNTDLPTMQTSKKTFEHITVLFHLQQ